MVECCWDFVFQDDGCGCCDCFDQVEFLGEWYVYGYDFVVCVVDWICVVDVGVDEFGIGGQCCEGVFDDCDDCGVQ